jgi:hypothetical protein
MKPHLIESGRVNRSAHREAPVLTLLRLRAGHRFATPFNVEVQNNNRLKEKAMKSLTLSPSSRRSSLAGKLHRTAWAVALAVLVCARLSKAEDTATLRPSPPELPSPACDSVNVPDGNRLIFHAYAFGVQIYRWSGTAWVFVAPEAALYVDPCYDRQVGIHYAGPTWEANDGSKVVAARQADCTPFRGAIPWLRLGTTSTTGPGKLAQVTYIQRVNTIGGTAPAEAGSFVGEETRVPYTAEYYFYRAALR